MMSGVAASLLSLAGGGAGLMMSLTLLNRKKLQLLCPSRVRFRWEEMGNYLKASDISRWKVVKPRPLMLDDGVVFSPNAISSPNKRVTHI